MDNYTEEKPPHVSKQQLRHLFAARLAVSLAIAQISFPWIRTPRYTPQGLKFATVPGSPSKRLLPRVHSSAVWTICLTHKPCEFAHTWEHLYIL